MDGFWYGPSGGGAGGILTMHVPVGSQVTASKDGKTYKKTANALGLAEFKGLATGTWTVTIHDPTGASEDRSMEKEVVANYTAVMAFFAATITATYPVGSTCTCSLGDTVLTAPDKLGTASFVVPKAGDWVIRSTDGESEDSKTVTIAEDGQEESVALAYRLTPEFTYSGNYEIVDETDNTISDFASWKGNWKVRFLTSGTLTIDSLYGFDGKVDLFLVGGGAGNSFFAGMNFAGSRPGGAGYHNTTLDYDIQPGIATELVIGAGGGFKGSGGKTTGFGLTVNGGSTGYTSENSQYSGSGGKSCYEFDAKTGTKKYAEVSGGRGTANTGQGAGPYTQGNGTGYYNGGGSGIIIMRNHR